MGQDQERAGTGPPAGADADAWEPARYHRFAAERRQPFVDLLHLVTPVPGGRVVDLGCGSGELTAELHHHTRAASTTGIDSSPAMLAEAARHAGGGLRFEPGDIAAIAAGAAGGRAEAAGGCAEGAGGAAGRGWDVVFANASLQWVPDHPALLAGLTATLAPGGQLAVQVPANADHASHRVVAEVAEQEPFRSSFPGGTVPADPVLGVLGPEAYAEHLHDLGYAEQHVRLQVYGHLLPDTEAVVAWTSGTTLTRVRRALPPDRYQAFEDAYRDRLLDVLGRRAPYFYAFKRILLWGRRPG